MAKRSNVPNASRGVVQSQFGLPRPAFSIGNWPSFSVSEASSMSLSFSSKGLSLRGAFCSARVVFRFFVLMGIVKSPLIRCRSIYLSPFERREHDAASDSSRQEQDNDHAPYREQRVADGVGDGVPEGRHLTLGLVT